jgi:hypothetical protein
MDMPGPVSFGEQIRNSKKGNRSNPWDPKFIDPKTGKIKDWKKSMQARGFKTTGGRDMRQVGDQPKPMGAPLLTPYGEVAEAPMAMNRPEYDIEAALNASEAAQSQIYSQPNVPGIYADTMPTVSDSGLEQQAQQVEGGPQVGSVPLSISRVETKPKKESFVQVPITTDDSFEPPEMEADQ